MDKYTNEDIMKALDMLTDSMVRLSETQTKMAEILEKISNTIYVIAVDKQGMS